MHNEFFLLIKSESFSTNTISMRACSNSLLGDVQPPEGEEQLLFDGVDGVDGQHQRLVLQHRRHVQPVDRHLEYNYVNTMRLHISEHN